MRSIYKLKFDLNIFFEHFVLSDRGLNYCSLEEDRVIYYAHWDSSTVRYRKNGGTRSIYPPLIAEGLTCYAG